jgi:hypothetical protein
MMIFKVEHHMERFSNQFGHKSIGPCGGGRVIPQSIGEAETYDKALDIVYDHIASIYPYQDMVKVLVRRGELVAYLREDPVVEQHYTIEKC